MSQNLYKKINGNSIILVKIDYQMKQSEIRENLTYLYKRIKYKLDGIYKFNFLSLEQIKSLLKSKSFDMEIFIEGEKKYISSTLLDIYLLENEKIVTLNVL